MGNQYTPQEIQAFSEKDLRIVRQNALSHAVEMVKMKGGPFDINEVFDHASSCVSFVFEGMTFPITLSTTTAPTNPASATNSVSSESPANPVLQAVADKLRAGGVAVDYSKLEEQVKQLFGGLPKSMDSVDQIIKSLNKEDLTCQN